ncbi:MAG TPA: hypothetical protein VFU06_00440 [Longimicrobiales bacterium]|nr:hypothetical protein [Longimicrobiales bacterium]
MSFDNSRLGPVVTSSSAVYDDGRTPLALAAGLAAALIAGGIWAALVFLTNMEIGYVAWGVGLLVGVAMSRMTSQRTQQLAYAAAAFAVVGLLAGKIFIYSGSAGRVADDLAENEEVLRGAVAWQMYGDGELDAETMAAVEAVETAGDTLSDALWADMLRQSDARLAQMTADEKHDVALFVADGALQEMGVVEGVRAQLSMFDLLWLFLAVGTAYRMMAPENRPAVAQREQEPTVPV